MDKPLSTESYKGVRDFYPDDMAVQEYILAVWAETAESFGFERYDASVLEPAELYKSKGAVNEELVNEQTYTFTDRGEREVTLRPEMTPTVARMVAKRSKELSFPLRWYSIPNLFRYERAQKGRLREHWQLNCDTFGSDAPAVDVEIITMASQILLNFGADPSTFEIRINDRREMRTLYDSLGITDEVVQAKITRLNDRIKKMSESEYLEELAELTSTKTAETTYNLISGKDPNDRNDVVDQLRVLGLKNCILDRSIARGFDYYTGTVFEIFDTSGENNRSLLGGGRYDNLTTLFGGDPISGIGFGMGDVTMKDFLETHNLLTADFPGSDIVIIPENDNQHILSQQIAQELRANELSVSVDFGTQKTDKRLKRAVDRFVHYALVLDDSTIQKKSYTLKDLSGGENINGTIEEIISKLN